jgi:hypothetical protein
MDTIAAPLRRKCIAFVLVVAAIAAAYALAAAPSASAHSGRRAAPPAVEGGGHLKPAKRPHTAPRRRPGHKRPRAVTIVVGGDGASMVVPEDRGCTDWFWFRPGARYVYYCQTGYFMYGEWQYTDYAYGQWTGSQWTYYGTYRCWKDSGGGSGVVIIGAPATTRCGWV